MTRQEMERRRLDAARELLAGEMQAKVAKKYGVSRTTASKWWWMLQGWPIPGRPVHGKGMKAMQLRRPTGRPCKLKKEELAEIATWPQMTQTKLTQAIEDRFGVQYDPDHAGRLKHQLLSRVGGAS